MDTVHRYFAALYLSRIVPTLIKECRTVVTCLTNNTWVPKPNPDVAEVTLHLDDLDEKEQAAHNGPKGAVALRNDALLVVRGDMRLLTGCVQIAADADISHAQTIIESAGMYVSTRIKQPKPELAARYGGSSGLAFLDAKALKVPGSYEWQMRIGGQEWTNLPPSVKARVLVSGLTPVTLYSFRYRTLTDKGFSDWSMVASYLAR
jgi:hypothetical protein